METDDEQRIIDEALNMVFSCGITGYKLEKMIGFTQAAISKWRNKKSRPTIRNAKDIIEKLSKILNSAEVEAPSVIYVPLVGKYAYAGYLHGFGDDVYIGVLPTVPFIIDEIGTPKGTYRAFEVRGDSMNDGTIDAYADGDLAICRLIDQSLYEHSPLHL